MEVYMLWGWYIGEGDGRAHGGKYIVGGILLWCQGIRFGIWEVGGVLEILKGKRV